MATKSGGQKARGWTTDVPVGSLVVVKSDDDMFRTYSVAETIYRDMSAVLRVADASGAEHDLQSVTSYYYQWTVPASRIDVPEAVTRGPWARIEDARAELATLRR